MCYRHSGGVHEEKRWLSSFGVLVLVVCGVVVYTCLNSAMYTVNQVNSKMDSQSNLFLLIACCRVKVTGTTSERNPLTTPSSQGQ